MPMQVPAAAPAGPGTLPAIRELPAEDWPRLLAHEPWATHGLPPAEVCRIIVAEDGGPGGPIVAFWGIVLGVHVEPLWIDPEHRGRPGLARRLWAAVTETLQAQGVRQAVAVILDGDAATNLPMATRLGFQRIPGGLYLVQVPPTPPITE